LGISSEFVTLHGGGNKGNRETVGQIVCQWWLAVVIIYACPAGTGKIRSI